jgi:hypothetical protein
MKPLSSWILLLAILTLACCTRSEQQKKTVLAIPVYGQSLALGEQAQRITDFDSLSWQCRHRVLTENLDEEFGYLSDTHFKQWSKKMLHDRHRAFELSVYGMSELVSKYLDSKGQGDSVVICTFAGGQGATSIVGLGRGSAPYKKFLEEIASAHEEAKTRGWDFVVPAFCWMQGENDIVWKTSSNYKRDLKAFHNALNKDVKAITKQRRNVVCITYQTNCLTLAKDYIPDEYHGKGNYVPNGQLELITDDSLFMSSGPTYPYSFIDNSAHIDGLSQKRLGYMEGLCVMRLLEAKESKGLIPRQFRRSGDTVIIKYDVPNPPMVLDTEAVARADHYGFSVINSANVNIIEKVMLLKDQVKLKCSQTPIQCKVRYAINGIRGKTGFKERARGNLRDSQGREYAARIGKKEYPLHNWSHQFDVLIK